MESFAMRWIVDWILQSVNMRRDAQLLCKAGLYADDIITEYDGTAATDNDSFVDYLRRKAVGDTVKIRYWRDGEYYECMITVGDLNSIGSEILDDAYGGSKFGF